MQFFSYNFQLISSHQCYLTFSIEKGSVEIIFQSSQEKFGHFFNWLHNFTIAVHN